MREKKVQLREKCGDFPALRDNLAALVLSRVGRGRAPETPINFQPRPRNSQPRFPGPRCQTPIGVGAKFTLDMRAK